MAANETLDQLLATPMGFKPTYTKLTDIIEHIKTNQAAITGNFDAIEALGGAPVTWPRASDTAVTLPELDGVADVYRCAMAGASVDVSLYEGAYVRLYGAISNSGASTLDVATSDGAVAILKMDAEGGLVPLSAGDMPSKMAVLLYSSAGWILMNPASAFSNHVVTSVLGDATDYNEGDFVYVIE